MSLYSEVLVTPVPLPLSSSLTLLSTPTAGRSLFASAPLPSNHLLLNSGPPFAKAIVESYRREVCETCFAHSELAEPPQSSWDLFEEGSKAGKGVRWFCCEECREIWRVTLGDVGRQAVIRVEEAIYKSRRNDKGVDEGVDEGPAAQDIVEAAWNDAVSEGQGEHLRENDDVDVVRILLDGLIGSYYDSLTSDSSIPVDDQRPSWKSIRSLVPSFLPYENPTSGLYALYSHIRMYHTLLFYLPDVLKPFWTPLFILTLLTRDASNSFGIWKGPDLLAFAIFPSASYFNHSCTPNVRKVMEKGRWKFWTKESVAKGEELCISYLGGGEIEAGKDRREKLKDGWGFDCRCLKCAENVANESNEES